MSQIGSSGKPKPTSLPPDSSSKQVEPKTTAKTDTVESKKQEEQQISITPPLPSPPKAKTVRTVASQAHAESIRGEKGQSEASKQQSMLQMMEKNKGESSSSSSLTKDIGREVSNLGVAGKYAAEKVGEKASVLGKGLVDKLKGKDPALADIKKSFGKEVRDDFVTAQKSAQQELAELRKQAGGYMTANDKEKLARLERLNSAFESEPITIARHISENRDDPTYKFLGPAKFASLEVTTRDLVDKSEAANQKRYGLSAMERVAIYGYTTQDFTTVNSELRKGAVTDPQVKSYVNHIQTGLSKLDDFVPQPGQKLYRGVRFGGLPPHIQAQYTPHGRLQDLAFTSTSTNPDVAFAGYDLKCTITGTQGKGGKILPFSAHAKEQEVLFPPGVRFAVDARTPMNPESIPKGQNWTVQDIADFEAKQNSWILRML